MPTVAEILAQSGLTPEQISALDAKAISAFDGVLSTAEQERKAAKEAQEAAELAQRANKEFYDQTIMPSLTGWEDKEKALQNEIANAKATAAFYEAQNKAAKEAGFVASDAPKFEVPARNSAGQFVPNTPGSTPGSPTFTLDQVKEGLGGTIGTLTDIQWKYQRLYGQPLPIAPTELVRQAEAQKMNPSDYASKTFNFQQKEQELVERQRAEERAKIIAEATAPLQEQLKLKDKEWQTKLEEEAKKISERGGNNPDVRRAAISNYPEVKKAIADGTRKDPLSMTREERQVEMRRQIQADVMANEESKSGAVA
jgi:hypothetical protein